MGAEDEQYQPSQEELEQFAQETNPEELEQTEARKAELEAQYEERQLEVVEKAERLQEKIKQKELEIEQVFEKIEELESQLAEKQMKIMGKLLNVFEIRALREKIGIQDLKSGDLQGELAGLKVLYEDFQKEARSRVEIDEAERMVSEFYADQVEQLDAREKDKQARDLTNVSRKHNAVLTHGFFSYKGPQQTSAMTKSGVRWRDMLHATLALEPHISTASTRLEMSPEEKIDRPYASIGVILKGGEVTHAEQNDAASYVSNGERRPASFSTRPIEEDIDNAINMSSVRDQPTNEILVRKPEAAALFFNSDVLNGVNNQASAEYKNEKLVIEIFEEGKRLGMPVYQRDVDTGHYHLVTSVQEVEVREQFDRVKKRVVEHSPEPANIEDILSSDFVLSDEKKEEMKKDILGSDVFHTDRLDLASVA